MARGLSGCALVDNLKSVNLNQSVSFQKIQNEVLEGRVAGSFSLPPFENQVVSFRFNAKEGT